MGGAASPFSWCLGFDPVTWVAAEASGAPNITYVDDLLTLTHGPGHTLLAYLGLLAAAHAAHLHMADHTCETATSARHRDAAVHPLRPFPVLVEPIGAEGFRLRQGPVRLYAEILGCLEPFRSDPAWEFTWCPCRCRTKLVVVLASHHRYWADALRGTPLAPAITSETRFFWAVNSAALPASMSSRRRLA